MRKLKEIGTCPTCECSLTIYKTSNYKRFVKCDACGTSYSLPKRGSISNSAMICPRSGFPIIIVEKPQQKAYFWTDQPCFSCIKTGKCIPVAELEAEFKELEVYGY